MNPDERPSKRDAFMAFFGKGWVSVYLDARRNGVKVPSEFARNRQLVLQYGDKMPIPIPDLEVNDEGITATLSFSRLPHRTFIPWSAVYFVSRDDGQGIFYYEDVPEDVPFMVRPITKTGETLGSGDSPVDLGEAGPRSDAAGEFVEEGTDGGEEEVTELEGGDEQVAGATEPAAGGRRSPGRSKGAKRPAKRERLLKSVPAETAEPEPPPADEQTAAARRRKRPQLRVVK